jgi:hypothetical protein
MSGLREWQAVNRELADVKTSCNGPLRLSGRYWRRSLALPVQREFRLAPESDALRLRCCAPAFGTFRQQTALQLLGNAEERKHDFGRVGRGFEEWPTQ